MALDLSTLAPVPGTGLTRRSSGREAGPNPFLDNGWLLNSYETEQDFEVTVGGTWERAVKTRGKHKGQEYDKLVGDAATVVRMLRDAADKLEIGVAIECVPAVKIVNEGKRNERTEDIPGQVTVKYLGKTRKVYKDREGTDEANGDEDKEEYPDTGDDDE